MAESSGSYRDPAAWRRRPKVQRTLWEEPFGITYFSLRRVVRVKIESQKLAVYSFAGIGAMQ